MKTKSKIPFSQSIGLMFVLGLFALSVGCRTYSKDEVTEAYSSIEKSGREKTSSATDTLVLREGDALNITFLGAPELNSDQTIRRDGKITLQLIGELVAVGMTPTQLENEIVRLCGPQLLSKEVRVAVNASGFPVFVTGAVLRPGKIMSDRPITALQSIMEAGGFDYSKADLTSVRVIRQEGREVRNFRINLKLPLQGKKSDPFDLKPADIIFVPEKFTWF